VYGAAEECKARVAELAARAAALEARAAQMNAHAEAIEVQTADLKTRRARLAVRAAKLRARRLMLAAQERTSSARHAELERWQGDFDTHVDLLAGWIGGYQGRAGAETPNGQIGPASLVAASLHTS